MSYLYETKIVNKPRTSNTCDNEKCNKKLPAGQPHLVAVWWDSEYVNSRVCDHACLAEWELQMNFEE